MSQESKYFIDKLGLVELDQEGGYYKETYRSGKIVTINNDHILNDFNNPTNDDNKHIKSRIISTDTRPVLTLIYYLLEGHQFSAFHKVKNDEIWHFYKGSPVTIYILNNDDSLLKIQLGNNPINNEHFHHVIKGDTWFGAEINNKSSYALMGCTVSPGFDFKDFKLGEKDELIKRYPNQKDTIKRLTRK